MNLPLSEWGGRDGADGDLIYLTTNRPNNLTKSEWGGRDGADGDEFFLRANVLVPRRRNGEAATERIETLEIIRNSRNLIMSEWGGRDGADGDPNAPRGV